MLSAATIATLFASLAAAQLHQAVGDSPSGNPISRPLTEIVPACKAFPISWQPTTPNTVSVLLVKGPPNNVVKFGPALAEGIANSGTLSWTPAADLPVTDGPAGYGIQIIDDVTGQYQYSNQFGISKGENCAVVSSSSASGTAPPASVSTGYGTATTNGTVTAKPTSTVHASVSGGAHNSTLVQPTKSLSVPSSLKPTGSATGSATTSRLPEATTNAAAAVQAGLGFAFAGVLALML